MSASSHTEFSAVLLDVYKNKTIWFGDITTKAGGTFFVGGKGDAKWLSHGVMNGLEKNGHIKALYKKPAKQPGPSGLN